MACIGVVVIHVLAAVLSHEVGAPRWLVRCFSAMQMLLMCSTPAFVFLSAAVVGYAYDGVPAGFLRKRIRFVFLPFVSVGIAWALFFALLAFRHHGDFGRLVGDWLIGSGRNLAGGAHTWFILPILQFYILYVLLENRLRCASPKIVIVGSLLVNVAYLAVFDALSTADFSYANPAGTPRDYRYSFFFPAWIGYFAAGYYCGQHYESFTRWSRLHVRLLATCSTCAAALMLWLHFGGVLTDVSSRRADIPLYAIAAIALVLHAGARLQRTPSWLVRVSQFSFGVYLLHPFVLEVLKRVLFSQLPSLPTPVQVVVLSTGTVVISLMVTAVLARLRLGSLLVGRIRHLDAADLPPIDREVVGCGISAVGSAGRKSMHPSSLSSFDKPKP